MEKHLLFRRFSGKRLLLGVSGSVAAFRAAELVHLWQNVGVELSATLTSAARRFVTPLTFEALGASPVYGVLFEDGDPFAHLEPGRSADAVVLAPASADLLARLCCGRAEDMLSAQVLAFDGPVVVAPAMNPRMWRNQATQANVDMLKERGFLFVGPESGAVACGDDGPGRMADLRAVYLAGLKALTPQDMEGRKIMVTLGPTRERWDDVRFWSNASSGVMGASFAVAAWLRGAEVHAVCGPVDLWFPDDSLFHCHNVTDAGEMLECARQCWRDVDAGIFTAAVADFRPEPHGPGKFKKDKAADGFSLRFLPNVDILKTLSDERGEERKIVGFAAESVQDTDALAAAVRRKLVSKGADIIVGNRIADGFGRASDRVLVMDAEGREESWPEMSKPQIAWKVLDWLRTLSA